MKNLSESDTFKKVIEAYSRPTKIIRGKIVDHAMQVTFISILVKLILSFSNLE
jgi:hypothetical protein